MNLRAPPISSKNPTGLCSVMRKVQVTGTVLGSLCDDTGTHYQHHLSVLEHIKPSTHFRSLRHLLQSPHPLGSELYVSKRDRLYLALTLASSVLQLDQTQWLREYWQDEDVYILHNPQNLKEPPAIDRLHPYLSRRIPTGLETRDSDTTASKETSQPARGENLLSLGLLLVELCFGESLEAMQKPEDSDDNASELQRQFNTARRLLYSIESETSLNYGDAVRRCLEYSSKYQEVNTEYDGFQREVFEDIVMPLRIDLDNHCGLLNI